MSIFNLDDQNAALDKKIVAGLERLSQVFRILLWEKAKAFGLSPIQIQLLIFIQHHSADKATVSYLAKEFNLTKPTISDAIKVLEQKALIEKFADTIDTRSYSIRLTSKGQNIVSQTENFADPLASMMATTSEADQVILWRNISGLILQLNRLQIISVQRMCFNCMHYALKNKIHFCNLLKIQLQTPDIRIDCPEFENA